MPSATELAVTEFIAAKLRAMREPQAGGRPLSFDKIAVELGITKPQIHSLVKGTGGAGIKVEQVFAERFFDGSIDRLRAEAQRWWQERNRVHPGPDGRGTGVLVPTVLLDPRYTSLSVVLNTPKYAGRWAPATIAAVQSLALDAESDPGEEWFLEALNRLDSVIKMSSPKLPDRSVDVAADIDERPVRTARKKGRESA